MALLFFYLPENKKGAFAPFYESVAKNYTHLEIW
jgi:hypothetical protein